MSTKLSMKVIARLSISVQRGQKSRNKGEISFNFNEQSTSPQFYYPSFRAKEKKIAKSIKYFNIGQLFKVKIKFFHLKLDTSQVSLMLQNLTVGKSQEISTRDHCSAHSLQGKPHSAILHIPPLLSWSSCSFLSFQI